VRCVVSRLPELPDAAHIRADSDDGAARVSNGLSLCKIHHGAFDSNIIGISPDYVAHVKASVLATFWIGNMIPTVIDDDLDAARARNRKTLQGYVALPNYRNYWIEAGYEVEVSGKNRR